MAILKFSLLLLLLFIIVIIQRYLNRVENKNTTFVSNRLGIWQLVDHDIRILFFLTIYIELY